MSNINLLYELFFYTCICTEQVGIGGDQVPSNQLGRSEQHHGQEQQPHRSVLATTTAVPATAFLISRPSNPVSTIVPPAMQHASVVLDHDQFHVPAILLHHHDKFQVIDSSWLALFHAFPRKLTE